MRDTRPLDAKSLGTKPLDAKPPLRYSSYLKLEELLDLQRRRTDAHDEVQFIVVHQVFELWFKLLLFELESIREAILKADLRAAMHLLHRVQEVIKSITAGLTVIETMRPYDFLEFRSVLTPASGFQSLQFREIEFISGSKDELYLRTYDDDPASAQVLRMRLQESSLWDAFVAVLRGRGLAADSDVEIVQSLLRIQKDSAFGDLDDLAEALIQYDLLFSQWRKRHVLMVERMIGARPGTGTQSIYKVVGEGYEAMRASGVAYLRSTLSKKFFPLLWESRTFLER